MQSDVSGRGQHTLKESYEKKRVKVLAKARK